MSLAANVLLADDEPLFRRSTQTILEQHGILCTVAGDAGQALELLARHEFDVLISDIKMAGNDDLALVRRLPEVAAGLPVILVTGFPTIETAIESLQLPVFAYLVKPFRYAVLIEKVQQAAERSRLHRALANARQQTEGYVAELHGLQDTLKTLPKADASPTATAFVRSTVHNILASLLELEAVTEKVVGKDTPVTLPEVSAIVSMKHLLHETVRVLEKTKTSFKSKDLGALRKKVEDFLVNSGERV